MSKISLTNLVNLQNETTAVNAINANDAAITTAFDNTISRDGTSPNQMNSSLDMNSNQIVNLPAPIALNSPLRLSDLNSFIGGGTISGIPAGGTTNQVLAKTSNSDFAVAWTSESAELTAGTNITVTGTSPATIATTASPTFSSVTTPLLVNTGTLTLPTSTDTLIGRATTDTLTHKTFDTAGTGNSLSINGTAVTAKTGTGSVVLATSPTIATPTLTSPTMTAPAIGAATGTSLVLTGGDILFATSGRGHIGTPTNDNANAGNLGEYIESVILSGSAVAITTATSKTVTSISLTAGDWDVDALGYILPAASTSVTQATSSLSGTTNVLDTTPGKSYGLAFQANVSSGFAYSLPIPPYRFSLSTTTTIFLVVQATFTVSTASAYGIIRARRIR